MKPRTIALLTDFGFEDPYVGIMKGIIADMSPSCPMIDITHKIPPGDIQRGAFVLWQASRDFPGGTVFLSVVDPGVGTERKGIFLQTRDQIFIGPDNGLFSYLLYNSEFSCWELSNPEFQRSNTSSTFHGRDIFAPAAAYAARSISGGEFGSEVKTLNELTKPTQIINEGSLEGEILSLDHFGNLFTSLGEFKRQEDSLHYRSWIDDCEIMINDTSQIHIQVKGRQLPWVKTFGSIDPASCAGLIGSTGLLEIIANQFSANELLGTKIGDPVILSWD
jgi:S-adenosyl-L-methionine hydrolase (adenosine-forming)